MLKPRKRLTKHKIKEDKLVTTYFKVMDFINNNSKLIMGVAIGIVAILALGILYSTSKKNAERKASVELAKGQLEYERQNITAAIDILENLVKNYEGTTSAGVGTFYLANFYFAQGNWDKAQSYFKKYLDSSGQSPELSCSAISGIGACLEQKGEYLKAAEYYEMAVRKYPKMFTAPQELMSAGRCYSLAGSPEQAQRVYQKIIQQFPDSDYKTEAELYLAKIAN